MAGRWSVGGVEHAGRTTTQIFEAREVEAWRTTTTYGGDRVATDPPAGAVAQMVISDARGRTTELRQYTAGAPTGTFHATTYGYDLAGNLEKVTDAEGNQWRFTFDLRGRQIRSDDPDKGISTNTYDDAGQLLTSTDARGHQLAYAYDALGRKTSQRLGGPTGAPQASWTYDTVAKGQLTTATRYANGAAYTTGVTQYDDAYRPLTEVVSVPPAEGALAGTYQTSYTYTLDGQVETMTLPAAGGLDSETIRTYFDDLGMAQWMGSGRGWGTYVSDSRFSAHGELTELKLGNTHAAQVQYAYDEATHRRTSTTLRRLIHDQGQGVPPGQAQPADVSIGYAFDPAGNPTTTTTAVTTTQGVTQTDTQCYAYDGLNRLASAWTPASGNCAATKAVAALGGPAPYWSDYTTSPIGNRLTQTAHTAAGTTTSTYTYPAAGADQPHAVASITHTGPAGTTTSTYDYDESGNTTTRTTTTGTQNLTWDPEGRLVTVDQEPDPSTFVYTAGGDRLIRREGGATPISNDLAVDGFARTLTGAWGPAEVGGVWSTAGPTSRFTVADGTGGLSLAAGQTLSAWLEQVSSESTEVQATISADKAMTGGGLYAHVYARRVDASAHYGARVRLNADGTVMLHATATNDTPIAGATVPGLTFAAGDQLRVRVQAEGTYPTTIRAKVWKAGQSEPGTWQVQTTDATTGLQTPGGIGVSAYLSASATNAPVQLSIDDLLATPIGTTPAPQGLAAQALDAAVSAEAGISEAMGAGAGGATTLYLPGGQELRLDAQTGQISATRYYAFAGQAVAMRTGPDAQDVTSLITDPQGTATIAITNNTTNDLTIRRLDPYGNPRGQATPWPGDHGFLNKPTDTTGLSAIGARYYDPTVGRFISVDPIMDLSDPQQWAAYNYANNNPTTYADPTGLIPLIDGQSSARGKYNPARGKSAAASPVPKSSSPPVSSGYITNYTTPSTKRSTPSPYTQWLSANRGAVATGLAIAGCLVPAVGQAACAGLQAAAFAVRAQQVAARDGLNAQTATAIGIDAGLTAVSFGMGSAISNSFRNVTILQGTRPLGVQAASGAAGAANTARAGADDALNGVGLRAQLTGEEISGGHAFQKHVIDQAEFPGITTRPQFASAIEDVVLNGEMRTLSGGRTAYWNNGTVVIRNPNAVDGGTAFRPTTGYDYFLNTLH